MDQFDNFLPSGTLARQEVGNGHHTKVGRAEDGTSALLWRAYIIY